MKLERHSRSYRRVAKRIYPDPGQTRDGMGRCPRPPELCRGPGVYGSTSTPATSAPSTSRTHMTGSRVSQTDPRRAVFCSQEAPLSTYKVRYAVYPSPALNITQVDYMYWTSGCCTVPGSWCTIPQRGVTPISSPDTEGVYSCHLLPFSPIPAFNTSATSKGNTPARNRPLRGACIKAAARNQVLALMTPPS